MFGLLKKANVFGLELNKQKLDFGSESLVVPLLEIIEDDVHITNTTEEQRSFLVKSNSDQYIMNINVITKAFTARDH